MEDFGTEVGELGGFFEVELAQGGGVFDEARVVVVHAVDVGPYLYLLAAEHGADEAGGVVGTATLQVVDGTCVVAADEALRDIEVVAGVRAEGFLQVFADVVEVGLAFDVGAHEVECGDEAYLDALFAQVVGHHVGTHDFALCEDHLLIAVHEVAVGKGVQVHELVLEEVACALCHLFGGVEFANVAQILGAQGVDDVVGCLGVALAQIVGDFDQ